MGKHVWGRHQKITFKGETLSLQEWAIQLKVRPSVLRWRIRSGWPLDEVMTGLKVDTGATVTFNGETLTIRQWAQRLGLQRSVVDARLRRGWPVEEALTQPLKRQYR